MRLDILLYVDINWQWSNRNVSEKVSLLETCFYRRFSTLQASVFLDRFPRASQKSLNRPNYFGLFSVSF